MGGTDGMRGDHVLPAGTYAAPHVRRCTCPADAIAWPRSPALGLLRRWCAGAVSTGTPNREFYIRHGMDPERIWPCVCPAYTEQFGAARAGRRSLPSPDDGELRIGFTGKLIARKGVDELLQAAALLPARACLVGHSGRGRTAAARASGTRRRARPRRRVTCRGFANTTEMPKLPAGFDVVVVPSRLDMGVLVTIEAMAAGSGDRQRRRRSVGTG